MSAITMTASTTSTMSAVPDKPANPPVDSLGLFTLTLTVGVAGEPPGGLFTLVTFCAAAIGRATSARRAPSRSAVLMLAPRWGRTRHPSGRDLDAGSPGSPQGI